MKLKACPRHVVYRTPNFRKKLPHGKKKTAQLTFKGIWEMILRLPSHHFPTVFKNSVGFPYLPNSFQGSQTAHLCSRRLLPWEGAATTGMMLTLHPLPPIKKAGMNGVDVLCSPPSWWIMKIMSVLFTPRKNCYLTRMVGGYPVSWYEKLMNTFSRILTSKMSSSKKIKCEAKNVFLISSISMLNSLISIYVCIHLCLYPSTIPSLSKIQESSTSPDSHRKVWNSQGGHRLFSPLLEHGTREQSSPSSSDDSMVFSPSPSHQQRINPSTTKGASFWGRPLLILKTPKPQAHRFFLVQIASFIAICFFCACKDGTQKKSPDFNGSNNSEVRSSWTPRVTNLPSLDICQKEWLKNHWFIWFPQPAPQTIKGKVSKFRARQKIRSQPLTYQRLNQPSPIRNLLKEVKLQNTQQLVESSRWKTAAFHLIQFLRL